MKKRIKNVSVIAGTMVLSLFLCACRTREEVLFLERETTTEAEGNSEMEFTADENASEKKELPIGSGTEGNEASNVWIAVHVCGAVVEAGVVKLEDGSRVMDAVEAAGGFLPGADEEYVNLATVLKDGDKVRIPTKAEVAEMSDADKMACDTGVSNQSKDDLQDNASGGAVLQKKVNINTADEDELCTLPGIGQTRARSILTYRTQHGAFHTIEDIMQVSGIKESSFQKIRDLIVAE